MTTRIPSSAIRLFAGATAALAVAGTLVACSSAKTSGSGAAATSHAGASQQRVELRRPRRERAPARGVRPAAQGTIAALAATSMEVQSPQSGQVTVTFGPTDRVHSNHGGREGLCGRRNMRRRHGCAQPVIRISGAEHPGPVREPASPGHELHRRDRSDHPAGQRHV